MTISAGDLYDAIRAAYKANPDRRPVPERIKDLPPGAIYCMRPGTTPTHDDLDAIMIFTEFLTEAARRKRAEP
jgi:hypothetical protein